MRCSGLVLHQRFLNQFYLQNLFNIKYSKMYRGKNDENDKVLGISKVTNASRPIESQSETLQKQIDSYTRQYEEEKRKLFRAHENHREVLKDYQNQMAQLKTLKTKKYKTELSTLNSKIKCLQIGLEKGISSYNEALSRNNQLKNQIDELRKDRKNQSEAFKSLILRIEEINSSTKNMEDDIQAKKQKVDKLKNEIMNVRSQNEKQYCTYRKNVEIMERSAIISLNLKDTIKNGTNKQATQTSDTQPIVKLRLKNLLLKNKEKIKVMELYKKNMEKIRQSFEEIKEESGIFDLEQITKTFLKQQEQNTFIFQYINKLTHQLEEIKEENQTLQQKIERQEERNSEYRNTLSGTPESKQRQKQIEEYLIKKKKPIERMNKFLEDISPALLAVLACENKEDQITFFNIEAFLSKLEKIIDEKYKDEKCEMKGLEIKDEVTKYCRAVPSFNIEDVKDKNQEGLLEQGKFRDYAAEFWEKKKSTRI